MNAVSVYPALCIVIITLLTTSVLNRFVSPQQVPRYRTIEGLRGYLALFVFICHSCAYYYYFKNDEWTEPPSNLYSQFGYTSVALFFMITGFLFSGKLIEAKKFPIDWLRFFVSRTLRLFPLYLIVLVVILLIVGLQSHFTLQEPFIRLLKRIVHWAAFTVMENPDINEVKNTWIITAGVTWTFTYEWLFYFSLPLVGLLFYRTNYSFTILVFTIVMIAIIVWKKELYPICFLPFPAGVLASFLVRSKTICTFASKKITGAIALLLLCLNVYLFNSSFDFIPILVLSFVFAVVACGNTFFNLLTHPISYTLGRTSYSIYLLHGPILYVVFHFVLDPSQVSTYSPMEHWLIVLCATPTLIITSYLTYRFVEKPAMDAVPQVTAYVKKTLRIKR